MFDWKILLAVFAALLLLSGGLIKDLGSGEVSMEDVKKFMGKIKNKIGEVISTSNFKVSVTRDIGVSGEVVNKGEYTFNGVRTKAMNVKYDPSSMNVTMDKKKIRIEKDVAKITFSNFQGDLHLSEGNVDLEGKVNSLTSQQLNLEGKEIDVKMDGKFIRISLDNIRIDQLNLGKKGGKLEAGPSVSISVKDKPVKLYSFFGDMAFYDGNLKLKGNISKVKSGSQEVSISMTS